MTSFLKELRDAAMNCPDRTYRKLLRDAADSITFYGRVLGGSWTREGMQALNGAWAHAERVLEEAPQAADPLLPLAGAPEPARLAA